MLNKISVLEIAIRMMLIIVSGSMVSIRLYFGNKDEFFDLPWIPLYFGLIVVYSAPIIFIIDLFFIITDKNGRSKISLRIFLLFFFLALAVSRCVLDKIESTRRYKLSVPEVSASSRYGDRH